MLSEREGPCPGGPQWGGGEGDAGVLPGTAKWKVGTGRSEGTSGRSPLAVLSEDPQAPCTV